MPDVDPLIAELEKADAVVSEPEDVPVQRRTPMPDVKNLVATYHFWAKRRESMRDETELAASNREAVLLLDAAMTSVVRPMDDILESEATRESFARTLHSSDARLMFRVLVATQGERWAHEFMSLHLAHEATDA